MALGVTSGVISMARYLLSELLAVFTRGHKQSPYGYEAGVFSSCFLIGFFSSVVFGIWARGTALRCRGGTRLVNWWGKKVLEVIWILIWVCSVGWE